MDDPDPVVNDLWAYSIGGKEFHCNQSDIENVIRQHFLRRRLTVRPSDADTAVSPIEIDAYRNLCFVIFARRMVPFAILSLVAGLLYVSTALIEFLRHDYVDYHDEALAAMALSGAVAIGYSIVQARRGSSDIIAQIRFNELVQHLRIRDTSGTLTLASVIMVIWGIAAAGAHLGLYHYDDFLEMFALFPHRVVAGQWYRLVTGALLHANLLHLLMNVVGLCVFGSFVEAAYSTATFWRVLTLSALAGAIGTVLLSTHEAAVGISGGVYGLALFLVSVSFRRKHALPSVSRLSIFLVMMLSLVISVIESNKYDVFGHGFGGACGLFLGLIRRNDASRLSSLFDEDAAHSWGTSEQ